MSDPVVVVRIDRQLAVVPSAPVGSPGPQGPAGTLVTSGLHFVTPQQYGAVADGVTDDSAAFVAAIAALKAFALNTGGGGFYKGSPKLFIPAGNYYLGTTTLDINHTLVIEGEGSGQFGPQAGGCSHLRWADGTNGIRTQSPNTSGNTTVDITTHDGAGGVVLRDLCLEGGFAGTESDHHGLVLRQAVKAYNLYIKNFPGEGVKAWAGTVIGNGVVGGNLSTTLLIGVKVEGCRGAIDIRGGDANVITTLNCEGYQCRWFGLLDDNGAGSNSHRGFHAASCGLVTGSWPQTQCSYSGRRKALKWGGDPTVAPSSDTTDTANWLDIEAGGAIANLIPAWVSTPNTFRAGGDYVTLNSAAVTLDSCYSEGGGFSQFNLYTLLINPTMTAQYFRGGMRLVPQNDGLSFQQSGTATLHIDGGGDLTLTARDLFGNYEGYITWSKGNGAYYLAKATSGHNFRVGTFGSFTTPVTIDAAALNLAAGIVVKVNGTQVVGARQTGTPADATDLATALTLINAMKAKLIAHGLIS